MIEKSIHNLMFCHQYFTRACVNGNVGVRSLWDNVASSFMDDSQIVRRGCDCQHQDGRELELYSMVNICESLINVVTENKPKMLMGDQPEGLNQNGKRSGTGVHNSPVADDEPPAKRRDLTYTVTRVERGKPAVLPMGKLIARFVDGTAGMG